MDDNKTKTIDGLEIYDEVLVAGTIFTGDLFHPISAPGNIEYAGVVLTPMCDLAQEKIEWVKLAKAKPFQTFLEEIFVPEQFKGMHEYRGRSEDDLKALARTFVYDQDSRDSRITLRLIVVLQRLFENVNPLKDSHYYLPGKGDRMRGWLVDFSYIFSIPMNELKNQQPLLRLKSPWREQLLNRYVGYSLRIGTLDYAKASINETIRAFFPELTTEQIDKRMK